MSPHAAFSRAVRTVVVCAGGARLRGRQARSAARPDSRSWRRSRRSSRCACRARPNAPPRHPKWRSSCPRQKSSGRRPGAHRDGRSADPAGLSRRTHFCPARGRVMAAATTVGLTRIRPARPASFDHRRLRLRDVPLGAAACPGGDVGGPMSSPRWNPRNRGRKPAVAEAVRSSGMEEMLTRGGPARSCR